MRGVSQRVAGSIELRHKAVSMRTLQGPLDRVDSGEVARKGRSRHVGIAGGVDSDGAGRVAVAAAKVSEVNKRRARGIQFRHKGVFGGSLQVGLEGVNRREVGRPRVPVTYVLPEESTAIAFPWSSLLPPK